jgi:hypothetical protein
MPDYSTWKQQIRSEIEANEGERPPTQEQLWRIAGRASESAAEWIGDMPATDETVQTATGDVLTSLVALEMVEETELETDDE